MKALSFLRPATRPFLLQKQQPTVATRSFSKSAAAMASTPAPKFAEGSDEPRLTKELEGLLGSRWALTADGQGIERSFKFKTFAKTWVRAGPNSNQQPATNSSRSGGKPNMID